MIPDIRFHEQAIEVLDGIRYFERSKQIWESGRKDAERWGFNVDKYIHKVDIAQRCINRLNERYLKGMTEYVNNLNKLQS